MTERPHTVRRTHWPRGDYWRGRDRVRLERWLRRLEQVTGTPHCAVVHPVGGDLFMIAACSARAAGTVRPMICGGMWSHEPHPEVLARTAAWFQEAGRWMAGERARLGISQAYLAGLAGIDVTQLSRLEQGRLGDGPTTAVWLAIVTSLRRVAVPQPSPLATETLPAQSVAWETALRDWLYVERTRRDLPLSHVATLAGINLQTLSKIENGEIDVSLRRWCLVHFALQRLPELPPDRERTISMERALRGYTQREVAQAMGLSSTSYFRLEQRADRGDPEPVARLRTALATLEPRRLTRATILQSLRMHFTPALWARLHAGAATATDGTDAAPDHEPPLSVPPTSGPSLPEHMARIIEVATALEEYLPAYLRKLRVYRGLDPADVAAWMARRPATLEKIETDLTRADAGTWGRALLAIQLLHVDDDALTRVRHTAVARPLLQQWPQALRDSLLMQYHAKGLGLSELAPYQSWASGRITLQGLLTAPSLSLRAWLRWHVVIGSLSTRHPHRTDTARDLLLLRISRRLTPMALARRLSLDARMISEAEAGRRPIPGHLAQPWRDHLRALPAHHLLPDESAALLDHVFGRTVWTRLRVHCTFV